MNSNATILDTLSPSELFDILPDAATATAPLAQSDQLSRWQPLTGDHRTVQEIVGLPKLRDGMTYFVEDPLHALVLRQAARAQGHTAEAMWDLRQEQYAVMVATSMSQTWE